MTLAIVAVLAMATLPLGVVARDERRRGNVDLTARMSTWALIAGWSVCALGTALYVGVSEVFRCEGPMSEFGRSSWQLLPFGQRCTFVGPPPRVERPALGPTIMLLIAVAGLPIVVWRVHRTGRTDRVRKT